MGDKLRVAGTAKEEINMWKNFCKFVESDQRLYMGVSDHLRLFNAKDVSNTQYIEFYSEEDLLIFKLKFG